MNKFSEECKAQIESAFGKGTDAFLLISGERDTASGMLEQLAEWRRIRRSLRVKDYTAEELEYIHSIWEMAANTYQSIERVAGPTIDEGESSAITYSS